MKLEYENGIYKITDYVIKQIVKKNDDNRYIADRCEHDKYDIIDDNMIRYSIHSLLIIDAHYLWETAIKDGKEFEISFVFGNTNKKFGLIDFRK